MIHNKFRYLLTLVALLAVTTGAWAQTVTVTWTLADLEANPDVTTFTKDGVTLKCDTRMSSGKSFNGPVTISTTLGNFTKIEITGTSSAPITTDGFTKEDKVSTWTGNAASISTPAAIAYATQFVFTIAPAEAPLTVEWNASTKTGTFSMPGNDVVLTPLYAPAAQWATEGEEPNVKTLTPTAAEGVIAGTDAPLIVEGTVAPGQGTVMYFATTEQLTAEQAAAADGWLSTLPTAANIADDGATVYVWYYIKGTDTPDGETPTADNTFNDSEICAQPLEVIVLSNKFDITFNAANANTIEAGKATVKVGDADATVTEGKLQGVKMGTKVTINAKQGYKFRKVEAKKGGAAAPEYADKVTMCEKNGDGKYLISSFFDGTNANITTITKEEAIALAEYLGGGNIRVVYEEYEFYGDRYARATNAAGNATGISLSTTNNSSVPLYYVPAGN